MSKRTCMEAALAKLNYRMRTEAELKEALRDMGYEDDEILNTAEELRSYGYLDDERYVREFYRYSRRKAHSESRIIRELAKKGIAAASARSTIDEFKASSEYEALGLEDDDRKAALKAGLSMAEKQLSSGRALDDAFLMRVGRRLASLGYDTGCCFFVMGEIRKEALKRRETEDDE